MDSHFFLGELCTFIIIYTVLIRLYRKKGQKKKGGKMGKKKLPIFLKNEKNALGKKKKRALDGGHKKTPFRKKKASFFFFTGRTG